MRPDYNIIFNLIEEKSRVLDLGCGEGDLLYLLAQKKDVIGQGIEVNEKAIYKAVEKSLSVFHGDIDSGLFEYPNQSFDYVILNKSLQEIIKADLVIKEALRIGKKVIISFPNFAHIQSRFQMLFRGITPITPSLPYKWHDTPNLHFLSISDFWEYCKEKNIHILKAFYLDGHKNVRFLPNLFAKEAIFLITK